MELTKPVASVDDTMSATTFEQLPLLATANDVRELIQFLKKRPFGVSVSDIVQPLRKRVFFPRKIEAYEFWQLVSRKGEHIKLSPLGWEFAKSLDPEARIYRTLLAQTLPYQKVLRWILNQDIDVITHTEVVSYWEEYHSDFLPGADEKSVYATAVCFFHLCQAAELGTLTIGKRGQPARFRVLRDELESHFETSSIEPRELRPSLVSLNEPAAIPNDSTPGNLRAIGPHTENLRVFISRGRGAVLANQISELLKLDGIESEIVERTSEGDGMIPGSTCEQMRRCDAAVIIIPSLDYTPVETPGHQLDTAISSEVNAAAVLYEGRILFVADVGFNIPESLRRFRWCKFDESELTWSAAVSLMSALKAMVATTAN